MSTLHETIFVGLSGGVDSSVTLLRLKQRGYHVVAVFIKTWQPDFITCTWKSERLDAMRVAATLDVPFITFDAVTAYKEEVADYMIREYREGRTPNPDVMCNEHVKFGAFLKFARSHGASKIATGHYAQVFFNKGVHELHRGADITKDQSYFLWRLTENQLAQVLFPVGDSQKSAIRGEAHSAHLPTSTKQDSQGICFLGEIDTKEFLSHYITPQPGVVQTEQGREIGIHTGALFYTIGERHGFTITDPEVKQYPHYVVEKNIESNTITVSRKPRVSTGTAVLVKNLVIRHTELLQGEIEVQFRYRQKPYRATLRFINPETIALDIIDPDYEVPSIGQSAVFYRGTLCIGGGIIEQTPRQK